ncbi:MAG: hypothetical protein JKY48_01415 [Flavobacteriales bacterium]|nr:hypothetical protein [Flavobacteriales bacterium]
MNLLKETEDRFKFFGVTEKDIKFIGSYSGEYSCTWDRFKEMANVEYDNSFGEPYVADDLVIVFLSGKWMERHEYDGREEWVMRVPPVKKENGKVLFKVVGEGGWNAIEGLN